MNSVRTHRVIVNLLAILFLCSRCFSVEAQQPGKVPRIGYLGLAGSKQQLPSREAFRQGLRDLGYVEGKNIFLEFRYAEGDRSRVPSLVAELVQLNVDTILSTSPVAIQAAKGATRTIPIVMVITADPIATGLVASLARPGGNITGLTSLTRELSGKRLELLKEITPSVLRVGVLGGDSNAFEAYRAAAGRLKLHVVSVEVQFPNPELENAFEPAIKARINALIMARTASLVSYRKRIADLAIKYRLPLMSEGSDEVEAGGLVSYAASTNEAFRRAAVYVNRILKGAKPAELPIEQPTKFELVINVKTAKQIGLTIPPNVLARADWVIK